MLRSPDVLVAYDWPVVGEGLALLVADHRLALEVQTVSPWDLDAALPIHPAPVVICRIPSVPVRRYARGWIGLDPTVATAAIVGTGGQ